MSAGKPHLARTHIVLKKTQLRNISSHGNEKMHSWWGLELVRLINFLNSNILSQLATRDHIRNVGWAITRSLPWLCWDLCKEDYLTEFFCLRIMLQPLRRSKNDIIFQNNFRMCGIISELTTTQYKEKTSFSHLIYAVLFAITRKHIVGLLYDY